MRGPGWGGVAERQTIRVEEGSSALGKALLGGSRDSVRKVISTLIQAISNGYKYLNSGYK